MSSFIMNVVVRKDAGDDFYPLKCVDGEGNGSPFQYSCLENPMDLGASRATVYGVAMSQTE